MQLLSSSIQMSLLHTICYLALNNQDPQRTMQILTRFEIHLMAKVVTATKAKGRARKAKARGRNSASPCRRSSWACTTRHHKAKPFALTITLAGATHHLVPGPTCAANRTAISSILNSNTNEMAIALESERDAWMKCLTAMVKQMNLTALSFLVTTVWNRVQGCLITCPLGTIGIKMSAIALSCFNQQLISSWIQDPRCVYVHWGVPCGTSSRARDIKMSKRSHGPPPLRNKQFPKGVGRLDIGRGSSWIRGWRSLDHHGLLTWPTPATWCSRQRATPHQSCVCVQQTTGPLLVTSGREPCHTVSHLRAKQGSIVRRLVSPIPVQRINGTLRDDVTKGRSGGNLCVLLAHSYRWCCRENFRSSRLCGLQKARRFSVKGHNPDKIQQPNKRITWNDPSEEPKNNTLRS